MSNGDTTIKTEEKQQTPWQTLTGRDWVLARLVHLANHTGLEVGITLTVGGSVVSGMLISGASFFKETSKFLKETVTTSPEGVEGLGYITEMIESVTATYIPIEKAESNFDIPPPAYIHLRGANWLSSNGHKLFGVGQLWRGRLSSIDGFFIGSSTGKPAPATP